MLGRPGGAAPAGNLPPRPGRFWAAAISLAGSYVGSALTIIKGIVFVPLYLRAFGIDIYGAFLASAGVVGLLAVVDFGVSSVLQQRLASEWGGNERGRFVRSTGAGLLAVGTLTSLLVLVAAPLAPFVPRLVGAPEHAHRALSVTFLLTALGSALSLVMTNVISIPSAWLRSQVGAVARLLGQIADLLAIIVGLSLGAGVVSLGLGNAVGGAVGLAVALSWTVAIWRRLGLGRVRAGYGDFVELARATAPVMLSRLAMQVGGNVEVALISALINPAAAGIYSITERSFRLGSSFINPIAGSAIASLAHFVGEHGPQAGLRPARQVTALWSLVLAAFFSAMLALNADFAAIWVGRANFGGFTLNLLIGSAVLLSAAEFLLCVFLTAAGQLRRMAWLTTVETLGRLLLMYPALHVLGVLGIPALSCLVSLACLPFYARGAILRARSADGGPSLLLSGGGASVVLLFGLGVIESAVLPPGTGWSTFIAKAISVGLFNLSLALATNPMGRAVLVSRLAVRKRRR